MSNETGSGLGLRHRTGSQNQLVQDQTAPVKVPAGKTRVSDATPVKSDGTGSDGVDSESKRAMSPQASNPLTPALSPAKSKGALNPPAPTVTGTAEPKPGEDELVDKVNSDLKAGGNTNYRIGKNANGQLRLERTVQPLHSYVITIYPSSNLHDADVQKVGEIIGKLLNLLEAQQTNEYGGIKSVTFSDNGGSLSYHRHPKGHKAVPFGGPANDLNVSGDNVRNLLRDLQDLLAKMSSPGIQVTATVEGKSDDNEDKTKSAAQTGPAGADLHRKQAAEDADKTAADEAAAVKTAADAAAAKKADEHKGDKEKAD